MKGALSSVNLLAVAERGGLMCSSLPFVRFVEQTSCPFPLMLQIGGYSVRGDVALCNAAVLKRPLQRLGSFLRNVMLKWNTGATGLSYALFWPNVQAMLSGSRIKSLGHGFLHAV
jgi:hypothetical protein